MRQVEVPTNCGIAKRMRNRPRISSIPTATGGIARAAYARGVAAGLDVASEGHTFGDVLDRLRFDLAKRYLQEHDLQISNVAWLLGYQETSAFYHAFRRWTGKTPTQARPARLRTAPRSALLHPSQRLP